MESIVEIMAKITLVLAALVFIIGFGYLAILEIRDLLKEG